MFLVVYVCIIPGRNFFFDEKNFFGHFVGLWSWENFIFDGTPKLDKYRFFSIFSQKNGFWAQFSTSRSGNFFRNIIMLNTHRKKILWWKNDFWLFCGSLKLGKLHFWWYPPNIFGGIIKNEVFPTSKIHKIAKNHFFITKFFFYVY